MSAPSAEVRSCDYAGCSVRAAISAGEWFFCEQHGRSHRQDDVDVPTVLPTSRLTAAEPRTGVTFSAARVASAALLLRRGQDENDVAQHLNLTLRELQLARARMLEEETLATKTCDHITDLPVRVLVENPANVRTDLGDPQELAELEQSILEHGLLQPLLVMRRAGQYVLLAGHRRLAAARSAGLNRVPVTIRGEISETRSIETMLVENLQRAALHPLDEAIAYQQLLDRGRTRSEIAAAVGKNPGHISMRLSLLNLTAGEQKAVRSGDLSIGDAYRAGRDRSARRRAWDTKRPKPRKVPHFTAQHPLATAVFQACASAGHEVTLKLGPGCGPCWETVIRTDQAARTEAPRAARPTPEEAPPLFSTFSPDPEVDDVAVLRACDGDRSVTLTLAERAAAVTELHRRGWSDSQVAGQLGITSRTVLRIRNRRRLPSNGVGV
jgi:ParB family chromosome partitioning protein